MSVVPSGLSRRDQTQRSLFLHAIATKRRKNKRLPALVANWFTKWCAEAALWLEQRSPSLNFHTPWPASRTSGPKRNGSRTTTILTPLRPAAGRRGRGMRGLEVRSLTFEVGTHRLRLFLIFSRFTPHSIHQSSIINKGQAFYRVGFIGGTSLSLRRAWEVLCSSFISRIFRFAPLNLIDLSC